MDRRTFLGTAALAVSAPSFASTPVIGTWEAHRKPREYLATPGRTKGERAPDVDLVKRLVASYRKSFKKSHYAGGMWTDFFQKRHGEMHKVFMAGQINDSATFLRDPASNDLHYGFDDTRIELTRAFSSNPARQAEYASICKMSLVTVAEALGAIRLENPERTPKPKPGPDTEKLLQAIDKAMGFKVDFPNPFPDEFGLQTERGVAGYRAIHALYQAHRIRQLSKGRILEIGAGTGRTAYYCHKMGLTDYTIVDLPFTGISAGYFLGRALGAVIPEGESGTGIKILSPDAFHAASTQYDLIVNIDSLTEMPVSVAEAYWRAIQKRSKLFLSINHEANDKTVMEITKVTPKERVPYWMRRGYAEEIY